VLQFPPFRRTVAEHALHISSSTMKITVSELIVQYLERLGVEVIFGMPGAHVLPIYDQLYDSSG
jgi:hypothetical protein